MNSGFFIIAIINGRIVSMNQNRYMEYEKAENHLRMTRGAYGQASIVNGLDLSSFNHTWIHEHGYNGAVAKLVSKGKWR